VGDQLVHDQRIDDVIEHFDHDLERGVVSDAQSGVRLLRDAALRQRGVDMLAAAVHDDELLAAMPGARDLAQHGVAALRVVEKAAAELDDLHSSPSLSSKPNIRLMFCTACEAAPFSRLSITETITARLPPCSSWNPISQRGVLTTFFNSGSRPAGKTRTNGAFS
jgi:hypothetical protein